MSAFLVPYIPAALCSGALCTYHIYQLSYLQRPKNISEEIFAYGIRKAKVLSVVESCLGTFSYGYTAPSPVGAAAFLLTNRAASKVYQQWAAPSLRGHFQHLHATNLGRLGGRLACLVEITTLSRFFSACYAAAVPLWQKTAFVALAYLARTYSMAFYPTDSLSSGMSVKNCNFLHVFDVISAIGMTLLLRNPILAPAASTALHLVALEALSYASASTKSS